MRHFFVASFLFSIAITMYSCQSSDKSAKQSSEPAINFSLKNFKNNQIYMYSCRGTRQMLIDSLPITNGYASVFIPREITPGIYRFTIDGSPIDLLISGENISVSVDASRADEPIRILESKENKCLYDFFYEYGSLSEQSDVSCLEVANLKMKYLNDTMPANSRAFIRLFLTSDPCLNEEICLNEMLINSPYTNSILQSVTTVKCKNYTPGKVLENIELCSDTTLDTKHELFTAFWHAGFSDAQPAMLNAILGADESIFMESYNKLNIAAGNHCIEAGAQFPTSRLIDGFPAGMHNLYYIIIYDGKELSESKDLMSLTTRLSQNQEQYFTIPHLELTDDVKREIGYIAGPMVFMIGKNDILADKWVGSRDIRTIH